MVHTGATRPETVVASGGGPPPLGPLRRTGREVGLAMIVGGLIVLLFVLYQLYGTTLTEQRDQSHLAHSFARAEAAGGARGVRPASAATDPDSPTVRSSAQGTDLSPSTPSGSAIEHMVIPAIGLDKYVVQGTDEQDLSEGPGHYVGTPFPGQKGNAAIAGHRTTYGAPFYRLADLRDGDRIYITNTKGRTFVYSVVRHLLAQPSGPSATAVLADTATSELTLTTCNPRFEAINRLVVVADLVGSPLPPAAASPTLPPAHTAPRVVTQAASPDDLGHGNASGWPPAIAYGALVVALWVATRLAVLRTRRWWRPASLVVGVAAAALPLWLCFENVVRILPTSI